jgi:nuclear transcription factor Y, gamma
MIKESIFCSPNNNMDQKTQVKPEERRNDTPTQNQSNQIVSVPRPLFHTASASAFSSYLSRVQLQEISHRQQKQQELQKKLGTFWAKQNEEVQKTVDFKSNGLPLARIKKIMKAEEGVSMISAEAPILFAKACEMFIMELATRSWANTEVNKRKTLQKSDIASAVSSNEVFDFLVDIVPREKTMERDIFMGIPRRESVPIGNVPYYVPMPAHMPPQYDAGPSYSPPRMLMGRYLLNQRNYNGQPPHPFANPMFPTPKQENDPSTDLPNLED